LITDYDSCRAHCLVSLINIFNFHFCGLFRHWMAGTSALGVAVGGFGNLRPTFSMSVADCRFNHSDGARDPDSRDVSSAAECTIVDSASDVLEPSV
jgi:hypothetical protein